MKKKHYLLVLSFLLYSFIFYSCDNSTQIKDGFTINGAVTDLNSGKAISSVKIFVGYNSADSVLFTDKNILSDSSGKYTFYGGPGTAPTDEVLRFENKDYVTKDVVLKNNVTYNNNYYTLYVSMQHK